MAILRDEWQAAQDNADQEAKGTNEEGRKAGAAALPS